MSAHKALGIVFVAFSIWHVRLNFRRRAKGRISFRELGRRLAFCEGDDMHASYMAYAERAATV